MANRLTTEILINLAGNLTAKARQYGANMSEFARTNQRAMSVVKATTAAAGRGLDALGNRYTTMIAGFAGSAMLKDFAATDRRITRMGLAAEKTKKKCPRCLAVCRMLRSSFVSMTAKWSARLRKSGQLPVILITAIRTETS